MKEEQDILNQLKKRKKPEVSEGFFDNFYAELSAKIAEEESGLSKLKKSAKPELDADYFKDFSASISQQAEPNTSSNKGIVISMKSVIWMTAIAACLVIGFFLIPDSQDDKGLKADTDTEVKSESSNLIENEVFLAMMDEDDVVNFLIENEDISLENTSKTSSEDYYDDEELYYYLEEDLEDLYLEDL